MSNMISRTVLKRSLSMLGLAVTLGCGAINTAMAAETPVAIGISGWTGFAPLTLADKAGIFKKNGLDVTLKMVPQSYGADGIAVRGGINKVADLKGKTISVDAPGTSSYFLLAWILDKNGMTMKDVKLATLGPDAAAHAFIAGQNDAAVTYEPYLSTIRQSPDKGKILTTTLDYPMVMDTLGCTPSWLDKNPKAAQALVNSYFEALDMIKKDPDKANEIMGAAVKETGKQFAEESSYLRWQDRDANKKFFSGEIVTFTNEAARLLTEMKILHKTPDINTLYDAKYVTQP